LKFNGQLWPKLLSNTKLLFILRKWNLIEADKFVSIVFNHLESLTKNPEIGIYNSKCDSFSIVISKQTTLFYRILESEKKVALVLFWNNKQNPIRLNKLLE
jgi:hypothetical protein